jgi:hypothetical protein
MKALSTKNRIEVALVTAVALGSLVGTAQDRMASADIAFKSGRDAYFAGRWREAEKNLKQSYGFYPDPLTAYLLSLTYVNLQDRAGAVDFARKALSLKPPLKANYQAAARSIVNQAPPDTSKKVNIENKAVIDTASPPTPPETSLDLMNRIGKLVKGSGNKYYVLENGKLRWIPDMETLYASGLDPSTVTVLDDQQLTSIPEGDNYPAKR